MAEERQGEARAADGGFSSLTAPFTPALSIPLTPAAVAALATGSGLGAYNPMGGLQGLGNQASLNLNTVQVCSLNATISEPRSVHTKLSSYACLRPCAV